MTTIQVEVRKDIRRPLAVVSRQFGDIAHHARNRVHPDVTFTVLGDDGATCRFRQQVRVAGMLQSDELVQRRTADGSLVADVVAGANKGMRIVQAFAPLGADATRVTFRADAPATGLKRLLKPLFERALGFSTAGLVDLAPLAGHDGVKNGRHGHHSREK